MARTPAGATLTETHRQAQLQLRARALQDYARIWPIWEGDNASFTRLTTAASALVTVYRTLSSSLAASYFGSYRAAERAGGSATPRLAPSLSREVVVGTLHVVGRDATLRAIKSGQSPEQVMKTALVRTSGAISRFTLDGGRQTTIASVAADREARGWARVTDSTPCAFCRLLASRGAVYSEDTADFQGHDHCGCSATAVYDGDELPDSRRYADEYNAAIRDARQNGDLRKGTSNELLNAYRRFLDRQATPA
jgi:hypothetical protein